jgi:hypothetical protein
LFYLEQRIKKNIRYGQERNKKKEKLYKYTEILIITSSLLLKKYQKTDPMTPRKITNDEPSERHLPLKTSVSPTIFKRQA